MFRTEGTRFSRTPTPSGYAGLFDDANATVPSQATAYRLNVNATAKYLNASGTWTDPNAIGAAGHSGGPLFVTDQEGTYIAGNFTWANATGQNGAEGRPNGVGGMLLTPRDKLAIDKQLELAGYEADDLPKDVIQGSDQSDAGSAQQAYSETFTPADLLGSFKHEIIYANGGDDIVDGYKGDDEIYGGDGNDTLFGGLGNDTLDGGADVDILDGGSGDDTLIGGDGADVFVMSKGADRIVNADATDRLYIRVGSLHPFAEERQDGEPLPEDALGLPVLGGYLAGEEAWEIRASQRYTTAIPLYDGNVPDGISIGFASTSFYAHFHEDFWPETYFYMEGDDLVIGIDWEYLDDPFEITVEDYEPGDLGLEFIPYPSSQETIEGYNDTVRRLFDNGSFAELPFAPLDEETGDESPGASPPGPGPYGYSPFIGGSGGDGAAGSANADRMYGGAGNDSLTAGGGNDTVSGGDGADVLEGGDGVDTLLYELSPVGVAVNLALGSGTAGEAAGDQLAGFENVLASYFDDAVTGSTGNNKIEVLDGNDTVDGNDGNDTLSGGNGNDYLAGSSGADILFGDAGNDYLGGGLDNDVILGGADDDLMEGGEGGDYLAGEAGNDILLGGDGANQLEGGIGNDYLAGGIGGDVLLGGDGVDQIEGGDGGDYIVGGAGDDVLLGGEGFDQVEGGDGNDYIDAGNGDEAVLGGNGNDYLIGGGGNDYVVGGAGADVLTGGVGSDAFYFADPSEGQDTVNDFSRAEGDHILLSSSGFGMGSLVEGVNFFVGSAPAPASATPTLLYNTVSGTFFYDADGSGGGGAVGIVALAGMPALQTSDILLV